MLHIGVGTDALVRSVLHIGVDIDAWILADHDKVGKWSYGVRHCDRAK